MGFTLDTVSSFLVIATQLHQVMVLIEEGGEKSTRCSYTLENDSLTQRCGNLITFHPVGVSFSSRVIDTSLSDPDCAPSCAAEGHR